MTEIKFRVDENVPIPQGNPFDVYSFDGILYPDGGFGGCGKVRTGVFMEVPEELDLIPEWSGEYETKSGDYGDTIKTSTPTPLGLKILDGEIWIIFPPNTYFYGEVVVNNKLADNHKPSFPLARIRVVEKLPKAKFKFVKEKA